MSFRPVSMIVVGAVTAAGVCGGTDRESAGQTSTACAVETERVPMPRSIRESSGIARTGDGALWTHNDGGEARLYRITEGGSIEQVVTLEGTGAADIEDIDAGPCPGGAGDCLWLADTGDNAGRRDQVALLVVSLPAAGVERAAATRIAFRYPAGPRDAEALAVLPSGEALIITKGRGTPIELYRLSAASAAGAPAALERIAQLGPRPERNADRVTGAGASEDGRWVAMRSNAALSIHRTETLLAGDSRPVLQFDVRGLGEPQGEGIDIASDGRVWLTSEAGGGGMPMLARLRCTLPE
ncbi:MAG TPA: hypothetical protein VMN78_04310 [Longimicrobiales bacterium]|nr:hypothetical protein [Longimicrobiales bacterium]